MKGKKYDMKFMGQEGFAQKKRRFILSNMRLFSQGLRPRLSWITFLGIRQNDSFCLVNAHRTFESELVTRTAWPLTRPGGFSHGRLPAVLLESSSFSVGYASDFFNRKIASSVPLASPALFSVSS